MKENASASLDANNTILFNLDLDVVNAVNQVITFMNEVRSMIDKRERAA